jgi:hypothetical protein
MHLKQALFLPLVYGWFLLICRGSLEGAAYCCTSRLVDCKVLKVQLIVVLVDWWIAKS